MPAPAALLLSLARSRRHTQGLAVDPGSFAAAALSGLMASLGGRKAGDAGAGLAFIVARQSACPPRVLPQI